MTHTTAADWSVAVFSSRESVSHLQKVVAACELACRERSAIIDVIVNGNASLAAEFRQSLVSPANPSSAATVRVWHVALGDKSHAWNTYIHEIRPGGAFTFFIDGYVEVLEDAFLKLEAALTTNPNAKAATGVDVMGRSAQKQASFQIAISGIHGNLYSMRRDVILQTRESGFRLPLGLYRTDAVLESCLKFNFDPATSAWDPSRILVLTNVHWRRPVLSAWRPTEPSRVFRRAQSLRGWSRWQDRRSTPLKSESARCGWCASMGLSTRHSGPRSPRSPARSAVRPRRSAIGCARRSVTAANARA